MSVKYVILNLLLCIVVLMVGAKNYEIWNRPVELASNKEAGKKSVVKTEIPSTTKVEKDPASVRSYISIAQKNIFSPERKDFPVVPDPVKKPHPRPQIVLYGVTITEDVQFATVVNPGRSLRKGEREMMTLKVGEQIAGYTIARILPNRIAMENTGDTFEVFLYDSKSPKKKMEARANIPPETEASVQSSPEASGESTESAPSQESPQKLSGSSQARVTPPLSLNKSASELLARSASRRRR